MAEYINTGLHLGMQPEETLNLTPGQFSDLIEVRNRENSKNE